jgi:hypothetical protein
VRGRGIDFEHRFKTSRWAEDLLIEALGANRGLLTVRFGLSEVRPEQELSYGGTRYKEPDLLTYLRGDLTEHQIHTLRNTDLVREPRPSFRRGGQLRFAVEKALAALEVEFSPYRAAEMKGRDWKPRTPEEWRKRPLKHANPPTAPNIFVKCEDLGPLLEWEEQFGAPTVVVHLFDQEAFAVDLRTVADFDEEYSNRPADQNMLQMTTGIFKSLQPYDRVDAQGAGERKLVFRVAPSAAVKAGDLRGVRVSTQLGISASKKYVSQVLFSGGRLDVTREFLDFLKNFRRRR